jgi:hypothetical protein
MKAKVRSPYIDKDTGTHYQEGQTVELTPERAKELSEKGFVTVTYQTKEEKTTRKKK